MCNTQKPRSLYGGQASVSLTGPEEPPLLQTFKSHKESQIIIPNVYNYFVNV